MGKSELRYVQEAFATNWLSTVGPNLAALEKAFSEQTGLPSVALGSGTAGLHLGLRLLQVGPGDEVICPTLTFAASCNPVLYQNAVPVFVDSERRSWNMDANILAETLKKRAERNRLPKAVVMVDLFGQCGDVHAIQSLCRHYEIPLLEDAAEALGAVYCGKLAGTFGDVGVFSFNGNKIITSTGGGMLVSTRSDWVEKVRYWSTQARDPDPSGINNYVHSEAGFNYRLSNVLAGIARGQLEILELRVQQRRAVFERYRSAFADLPGIEPQEEVQYFNREELWRGTNRRADAGCGTEEAAPLDPGSSTALPTSRHTRWLSCFLVQEEAFGMSAPDLIRFLDAANVEARPVWKPMHTQPLYAGYECIQGQIADELNRCGICLPSSSSLSEEQQQFVIERVREAHRIRKRN